MILNKIGVCVCMHVCVPACLLACVVYMHMGILMYSILPYSLEKGLLLKLELGGQSASPSNPPVSASPPPKPLQGGGFRCTGAGLVLLWEF